MLEVIKNETSSNKKKATKKGIVMKQRKQGGDVVTPLDDADNHARTADSYFPLDIAFQASCGSNLLFRLEIQEYQGPATPSMTPNATDRAAT